jgi:nucleoside-diphosphate-sugar epimerase
VLIIGGSSFVAQHLIEALLLSHAQVSATYSKNGKLPELPADVKQFELDFMSPDNEIRDSFHVIFDTIGVPDVVINCVGLTSLKACESNKETCGKINVPKGLVMALNRLPQKPYLVQLSTDKVFKGSSNHQPYTEYEKPENLVPPNEYGLSKLAGEELITESEANSLLHTLTSHPPNISATINSRLQPLRNPASLPSAWAARSILAHALRQVSAMAARCISIRQNEKSTGRFLQVVHSPLHTCSATCTDPFTLSVQ